MVMNFARHSNLVLVFSVVWLATAQLSAAAAPPDLTEPPAEAIRHASGLVSKVLTSGDGAKKPDGNDVVTVHMVGWTPDGKEFQNTYAAGTPRNFNLDYVFPGWREGLQLMVVGEKRRLWIPANLAPENPRGGPAGEVVFDVELLGIISVPEPPEHLASPAPGAIPMASGSFSKVLEEGDGEIQPSLSSSVLLFYTGWTADGKIFDSTLDKPRPTLFPLEKVMPAFADCVMEMVEDEKRRCWIPGEVAQGQWTGAPQGPLVFDIYLVGIGDTEKIFSEAPPAAGSS